MAGAARAVAPGGRWCPWGRFVSRALGRGGWATAARGGGGSATGGIASKIFDKLYELGYITELE